MKYEPYNFESFKKLLTYAYSLGWYSGNKNLFTLSCDGGFEAFTSRATEDWEQQFTLTSDEIQIDNGKKIPALEIKGDTPEAVCREALKILKEKL